ncbi:hypothetical protein GGI20_004518 [Coemansia sp. BCRC 34301]|nr:hypothetical protein GGI20_004518 [Coemansia sp. BCRC 34301]
MARFSCCGLLRRSISLVSLLAILFILAIPVALLVFLLVLTFKPSSITPAKVLAPGERQDMTFRLAWQEPFVYEAKVYTSLGSKFTNSKSFFETAQLVWHVKPQNIGNRYPVLRHKASVHIPGQLRSSPGTDKGLYAHMFIQQAGRFNPHPDLTDPYLALSAIPLVQWSDKYPSDSANTEASAAPSEQQELRLFGVSSASWAIVLENHTYSWFDIPSGLSITYEPSNAGTYIPPLLPNTFTKGLPEKKHLVALRNKQLAADVYQQTIDVELELAGIKQSWVSVKAVLTGIFAGKNPTTVAPHPFNSGESTTYSYEASAKDESVSLLGIVHSHGVPALIYLVACGAMLVALLPTFLRLVVRLWSTPVSRWIGMSRATISVLLCAHFLNAVHQVVEEGAYSILYQLELAAIVIVASTLDDMTFGPWVALSRVFCRVFRRKSLPGLGRSPSAQQLALSAEDKTESNLTDVSALSNAYFRRPGPVIAARRSIDDIATHWVHLLALPAIALVAIYVAVDQGGRILSLDFVKGLLGWSAHILLSFAWLPQMIVNYKTKSGSLTPVTYNIVQLVGYVAGGSFRYMMGENETEVIASYTYLILLCDIIIILQRIVYFRRAKQD